MVFAVDFLTPQSRLPHCDKVVNALKLFYQLTCDDATEARVLGKGLKILQPLVRRHGFLDV